MLGTVDGEVCESAASKCPLRTGGGAVFGNGWMNSELERYSKQVLFAPLGEERQRRLLDSKVLLCGCGALGTVLADTLTRAGVGQLRIVDRDFVELSNLQRQVLYDEQDIADHLPKAIAAAAKLRKINSAISIEPIVADIDHTNILTFCLGIE